MSKKNNMSAQGEFNYEKSRYVVRRFVPVLLLAAAVNIYCIAVDVSKVILAGVISGAVLAIVLSLITTFAEKRYPGSDPSSRRP